MIQYTINKHKVKIYDSIEEMPIVNFQKYNKFMLIDSIIGSDLNDIDTHILKVVKYIQQNETELAVKQLDNLRQSLYFIAREISPKYLAFVTLIAEIDGTPLEDLSDSNVKEIQAQLNVERKSVFDSILNRFKKKVDIELSTYFPKNVNDNLSKELYSKLKTRTLLELDYILTGVDNDKNIEELTDAILLSSKPQVFVGPDSFEIKLDKQFNELCLYISQKLNTQVKKLTVFEFYNALEYIDKINKIEKSAI